MAVKIYVVYYSLYGNIERLAKEVAKGVNSVEGVEATLWQIPETLSAEELAIMGASPRSNDVPVITPNDLTQADGFIFGVPTIQGSEGQAFADAAEDLRITQKLAGKPATMFTNHGAGPEIQLHFMGELFRFGMICVELTLAIDYVPHDDSLVDSIIGGPSFGLLLAFQNGSYFAGITKNLKEVNE